MNQCIANSFASGEALEDALFISPSMLFQVDEIAIVRTFDARVWDGKEMDDFRSCLTMCQDFVSVLYESQKKYESKTTEAKTSP